MIRSGTADLPLHGGRVPYWLARRMKDLGGSITEAIVWEYGQSAFLSRLSDPRWFQAFGCVLGMDWHSSGITTSVMGALKGALNPRYPDLGIWVCGGRGKHSLQTQDELRAFGDRTGQDGNELARKSRLGAKVDNTAIQDGYQLYLHNFIVTSSGEWAIVQQGMDQRHGQARRYHWHSERVHSFTNDPHSAIAGINHGLLLNLTDRQADVTRAGILRLVREDHPALRRDIRKIIMPSHHEVRASDVNIRQLGAVLALTQEKLPADFEELLLTPGLGPRTLQSLALVSEVIHGTPVRFDDPARFAFAHGGKDGHPFPVPLKVYDETINFMDKSVRAARMGHSDRNKALKSLHSMAKEIERDFKPRPANFRNYLARERQLSPSLGGMTVTGPARSEGQLSLF